MFFKVVNYQRLSAPLGSDVGVSTIATVVTAAGEELLCPVEIPNEGRTAVSGPVLYDSTAEPVALPGAIALAISMAPDRGDMRERMADLQRAGYAGVVYKANGASDVELRVAARTEGLALLRAANTVPWHHLMDILNAAITPNEHAGRTLEDIRPGDLFDLANTVAVQTSGAVAIVDHERRVLAYSTLPDQPIDETRRRSILQLQVPDNEQNDADYRRVYASTGVVAVATESPSLKRLAIAIRSGDALLGSLWVLQPRGQADTPERLLTEAANLSALHILHRRATYISTLTRQADLTRTFLFEPRQAKLSGVRVGFSAEHVAIVAIGARQLRGGPPETLQSRLRLFDLVRTSCAVHLPAAVCGIRDHIVYIVLPRDKVSSEAFQRAAILQIMQNTRSLSSRTLLAGFGATVPIANLVTSRIDAEEILVELEHQADEGRFDVHGEGALSDREALGSAPYLRQIISELKASGRLPGAFAARIAEYDEHHGTSFTVTLREYLNSGCNALETARSLGLHVNTVRYRLSRIEPLFGLDVSNPETRLLIWLQLWNKYE